MRDRIGVEMIVRALRVAFVVTIAASAAAQLNPTVKLLDKPSGPLPAECEDGRAPQPAQRVEVAQIPVERDTSRDLEPPPSLDLRSQVRAAQAAAASNDRPGFKAAVARIKTMLAGYPAGGERDAAAEVISVYNDLERLWDFQFESTTGSFFAEGSEMHKIMGKYRGYEEAVRRQIVTDSTGAKFYPTSESKNFLIREAAQRLSRFGFPPPAPAPAPVPAPATAPPRIKPPAQQRETPVIKTTTAAPKPRRKPTSSGGEAPAPVRRTAKVRTSEAPVRHAPSPKVAPPPPAPQPAAPIEVPPGASVIATTTTAEPPAETIPPADTVAPATDTTTTTAAPAKEKGRNIILPIMLILIGVGVLIVLFRTSA